MSRKRQAWATGDIFAIGLRNGDSSIGQIVGQESAILNSVSVALFATCLKSQSVGPAHPPLAAGDVFSVLFSTRELLDSGAWRIIGREPVMIPSAWLPFETLRSDGFVGAKVYGAGIIVDFVNAYFALTAWDDWKQPDYLDRLLLNPEKKPKHLLYKSGTKRRE